MQHTANVADDDFEKSTTIEIEGAALGTSPRQMQETDFDDPFLGKGEDLLKLDGLSQNFKRNASRRLQKSYTGLDDAKSKKLDPLDLTG